MITQGLTWAPRTSLGVEQNPPDMGTLNLTRPCQLLSWARSKMYENTLIISSKQLRNKVAWFLQSQ